MVTKNSHDFIVFDLETQRDFASVGGRAYIDELKISAGVLWDSKEEKFFTYREADVETLIDKIFNADLIVGFNHIYFDFEVLSGYRPKQQRKDFLAKLKSLNNLDLMFNIRQSTGHRVSLDSLVTPTLGHAKTADGLAALRWYKEFCETNDEKYMQNIIEYCQKDVELTRNLYLEGVEHGKILHSSKNGDIRWIKVNWAAHEYTRVLDEAEKKNQPVENQLNLF